MFYLIYRRRSVRDPGLRLACPGRREQRPLDKQAPVPVIQSHGLPQACARAGLRGVRLARVRFDHAAGPAAGSEPLSGEVLVHRLRIDRLEGEQPGCPTSRRRRVCSDPTTREAVSIKRSGAKRQEGMPPATFGGD